MRSSILSLAAAAAAGSALAGKVSYAGVNIAGLDFGCDTSGNCVTSNVVDPGEDGLAQMQHFVTDDGLNAFRLTVGWQFLVDNQLGGTLDSTNFATYDKQVRGCIDAGADMCIIDIHNYARWNGQIIGQGGPDNAQFASLWSQLASKYADQPEVVFGIMNEPHDVDISAWATTVQEAVTAIREEEGSSSTSTTHKILLPGNEWTHATSFVSSGSAAALSEVTNPDGSTDNLIFDVHAYLDSDGSGTSTICSTDNAAAFRSLGDFLRANQRQAILTETGGGPSEASCVEKLGSQFDVLNEYSDVYLGWIGWAAGKFDSTYELAETPVREGDGWRDVELVTKVVAKKFQA